MVHANGFGDYTIGFSDNKLMGKVSIFRLVNACSANPHRLWNDIFNCLLRLVLHGVELADNTFQSATCYLLALAQALGYTICGNFGTLVYSNDCYDHLGACVSRLEPYRNGVSMDSHSSKAALQGPRVESNTLV